MSKQALERQDVAKRRRIYLRKKAKAIVPAVVTGSISIFVIVTMLRLALQPGRMSDAQFALFLLLLGVTIPCTFLIIAFEKEARSIPYVPPISEQIAGLPAEAVLLRGADSSVAVPEELLRPAHKGAETDAAELLRTEIEVNNITGSVR